VNAPITTALGLWLILILLVIGALYHDERERRRDIFGRRK